MNTEEKSLIEILNKVLNDRRKNITSLEELSNFNNIVELIKIM